MEEAGAKWGKCRTAFWEDVKNGKGQRHPCTRILSQRNRRGCLPGLDEVIMEVTALPNCVCPTDMQSEENHGKSSQARNRQS